MLRVIAHRTCPLHARENSIEGIVTAARLGSDAVEIDVRLTRDGGAVLNHDRTAWRMARWPVPIRWSSARRLQQRKLVTLTDALAALPADLGMNIDVKASDALDATIAAVRDIERVVLWVRDAASVERARTARPGGVIGLLRDPKTAADVDAYIELAARCGADEVSVHERLVSADAVAAARRVGLDFHGWVTARDSLQRVVDAGDDGVVTDWPEDAVALRLA